MLDPKSGRAQLREDGSTLFISIPSKTRWFGSVFICFWLMGWAVGWLSAFGMLMSGPGAASVFLLAWLGAWTVGGLFALTFVLWNFAGEEKVTISHTVVIIERRIPFWIRKIDCAVASITDLRAAPAPAMPVFEKNLPGLWVGRDKGSVIFTYGVHTLGFGLDLDVAEARKMVALIHNRFPDLALPT